MPKKLPRQTIREEVCADIEWNIEGPIEKAIEFLTELKAKHPGKELQINVEAESGYYDSCSSKVVVYRDRPETDAEYEARLAQNKAWKKHQDDCERAEFERLSKKFGSTT